MGRARPRQVRLPLEEREADLLDRYANYRVLRKAYLSATALASFSTCNVKPFVERVVDATGRGVETAAMRAGVLAHEEVQGALAAHAAPSPLTLAQAVSTGAFLFAHELPLRDDRRMLRGIADVVFATGGEGYVVELKNSRPPADVDPVWGLRVRGEHATQVAVYGLLAKRVFGRTPRILVSYLQGGARGAVLDRIAEHPDPEAALRTLLGRSVEVPFDATTQERVNHYIRAFRKTERQLVLPAPNHDSPATCRACYVRAWCARRLDRPGLFEPLAAGLLSKVGEGATVGFAHSISKPIQQL